MNLKKDGSKEEIAVEYSIGSQESKGEILVSSCKRKSVPEKILISNVQRSRVNSGNLEHQLFPSIPKHITTCDGKYLLHCLELIHRCAARASTWHFSSKVHTLPDDLSSLTQSKIRGSHDMTRLFIEYPLVTGADVIISDWNISTVRGCGSGSQNMVNMFTSPLLKQLGSTDFHTNYGRTGLHDISEPVHNAFSGFVPQVSSYSLSHKPQNEAVVTNHKSICAPGHVGSVSSTSSGSPNKFPSSSSSTSFQGTLQCTWKDGLPYHVFSVDDKREVYWSNAVKVESLDDKALDYVYTFYAGKQVKRELVIQELESIATMRVSKTITLCSSNKEVAETQFILSVSSEDHYEEPNSNHTHKKNKRFIRKVASVFRLRQSSKHRSLSRTWGLSTISEETLSEPAEEIFDPPAQPADAGEGKSHIPSLEVAAIIVKEIRSYSKQADLGGWGLKFLKKSENDASIEKPESSQKTRNNNECSTSMNVLIPAALHGGPKTRAGGPSSLTERWISGGSCDCGGWDIGCPLTILVPRYSSTDSSPSEDCLGGRNPVHLSIQGSKQDSPVLKMVNAQEGLYDIHFQSTLSSLQSFAIAAAVIHSHNPRLQSRVR